MKETAVAAVVALSMEERDYLSRQLRRGDVAPAFADRCAIVLRCAEGLDDGRIAAALGVRRSAPNGGEMAPPLPPPPHRRPVELVAGRFRRGGGDPADRHRNLGGQCLRARLRPGRRLVRTVVHKVSPTRSAHLPGLSGGRVRPSLGMSRATSKDLQPLKSRRSRSSRGWSCARCQRSRAGRGRGRKWSRRPRARVRFGSPGSAARGSRAAGRSGRPSP